MKEWGLLDYSGLTKTSRDLLFYWKDENRHNKLFYEHQGVARHYMPDFLTKMEMPDKSILNLLIEVTGKKDDKKIVKVKTAREFWVPAVNSDGRFGRWPSWKFRIFMRYKILSTYQ